MIKWSKPDAQGRIFAEVNQRTVGFVKPVAASKDPEFAWDLVALGTNVFVERTGECKTQRGAKKALVRNWQRFCDRFNLVSREEYRYMEAQQRGIYATGGNDFKNVVPLR